MKDISSSMKSHLKCVVTGYQIIIIVIIIIIIIIINFI